MNSLHFPASRACLLIAFSLCTGAYAEEEMPATQTILLCLPWQGRGGRISMEQLTTNPQLGENFQQ
ncbi:MAG: hypothetical protein WKF37_24385 [Bryobacteraceae bacterium]